MAFAMVAADDGATVDHRGGEPPAADDDDCTSGRVSDVVKKATARITRRLLPWEERVESSGCPILSLKSELTVRDDPMSLVTVAEAGDPPVQTAGWHGHRPVAHAYTVPHWDA
jgi:hypothetical protein